MGLSLFLNSLLQLYLSFSSEFLYNNLNQISIMVLSVFFFLLFIFFVGMPSTSKYQENEHIQKHRCRARRRRKGGTCKGLRYHHSKKEEKELISFLKSPLGRNYDTVHFRQLLCPDPSCDTCNNATAEINRLFSKALEDSTPSVSPVASTPPVTAPLTEPSFNQSSAFPGVPTGELIPTPLPKPSPPTPSGLPLNSTTTLSSLLSPSPPGQTLPPEPVCHSSTQPKDLFSSTLTQYDFQEGFLALHSTKISFGADPAAKLIDQKHLLFLNPDEPESAQEYLHPNTWKDNLKQLFWGLPSLHSESLSSAVRAPGDYLIFFNSISNAFTDKESPGPPYLLSPSLPEVQPQPLPQTLPQSQHLHLTQTQPQTHLQSPHPILPSSPITQNRPKNESECLASSKTEYMECNMLQKEQESLWGLTSVVQTSKAHVAISIDPVEFPLSSEFQEKFESHLRERLIQHHKGQPYMINRSLSQRRPLSLDVDSAPWLQNNRSDIPESKSSSGLSWVSVGKDQISKNPNVGLSQPGSFYEKSSERFQLEENEGKNEGHSPANYPKVHLLSDSKTSSNKDMGSGSDMSLSRENSMVSGRSVTQRQLENVQKIHVSKKVEKISESQLLGTVHSSQHSINQISSIKSHTKLEQRSLPSDGKNYSLDTSQELPLIECGAQQMQKPYIPKFQMRMTGLPTKVLKSKEHFELQDTTSHSLTDPNSSSSTKLIPEANTKSGAFMPLKESSESLLGDKVGTENAADYLNFPLPATSLVDKKGHKSTNIQHIVSEEIQKILKAKLPITNINSDKKSQRHSLIANIQPPKMPTRRVGTPQTSNNSMNSNDRAEIRQGANGEKSELDFIHSVSREIVRDEGLNFLQPKTSGVLPTSKPEISQKRNREITVTTRNPLSKLSVQAPDLSELQTQIMTELKLTLQKKYSLAQGQPTNISHDSDSLTFKAAPTPAEDVSTVDMEVPQVLHVQSEDSGVRMEQQQEPWLPKHMLRSCQDQNVSPDVKEDIMDSSPKPTDPTYEELGAGDAQLGTSKPVGKRFLSEIIALEEMFGRKYHQTLPQTGQALRESLFVSKMKNFIRRIHPRINCKMQEIPQEKGSTMYSAQSRSSIKNRAAFTGTTQVHRVMSDIGKFQEEKWGRQHAGVTNCPQEPLPSAVQSGKPVQKGTVQIQVEPVKGRPFHCKTPSYEVANAMSGHHAAILAGQDSTCSRQTKNEDRYPQSIVTLKGQQIQKHPQSVPLKGTVPHPSPTCRPQTAKGPPAVLTTAGGTASRDQPPRFRHTMLLQNFQGNTFQAPK